MTEQAQPQDTFEVGDTYRVPGTDMAVHTYWDGSSATFDIEPPSEPLSASSIADLVRTFTRVEQDLVARATAGGG